jgi:dipeptidase
LYRLTGRDYPLDPDQLPFSTRPKADRVSLQDLFGVLADHYEGTENTSIATLPSTPITR